MNERSPILGLGSGFLVEERRRRKSDSAGRLSGYGNGGRLSRESRMRVMMYFVL
jgi:hypothetical protein